MHQSMLSSIIVDCDDLEVGVKFWSQAMGTSITYQDDNYVFFERVPGSGGMDIGFQRVPEPKTVKNRVHLDIMADDIEAEVKRLEGLGARRVAYIETWWWMEDPCGNEFCVVKVSRDDFPALAHRWED